MRSFTRLIPLSCYKQICINFESRLFCIKKYCKTALYDQTSSKPWSTSRCLWRGALWLVPVTRCLWLGGMWLGCLWLNDSWLGALWLGGLWLSDLWLSELWPGGLWIRGLWPGGLWLDSLWPGALWQGSLWLGICGSELKLWLQLVSAQQILLSLRNGNKSFR